MLRKVLQLPHPVGKSITLTESLPGHPHGITILGVCMNESEFVIVDDSGVKGPNRPAHVSISSPLDDEGSHNFSAFRTLSIHCTPAKRMVSSLA
jgi:hypothetical protein